MNTVQEALQHTKTLLRAEIKSLFLNDKDDEAFSKMLSLSMLDGVIYNLEDEDDLEDRVATMEEALKAICNTAMETNKLLESQMQ